MTFSQAPISDGWTHWAPQALPGSSDLRNNLDDGAISRWGCIAFGHKACERRQFTGTNMPVSISMSRTATGLRLNVKRQ
jgi:hypothetical protein